MRVKRVNHVVVKSTYEGLRFECGHCGTTYTPSYPVPIPMFVAMGKEFGKQHRNCKPKEKQSA